MSDWAKKLRTVKHEPRRCYNSQDLGHREHCTLMCGNRDGECDCESSTIFEIVQGAAKHIQETEDTIDNIIKELSKVDCIPHTDWCETSAPLGVMCDCDSEIFMNIIDSAIINLRKIIKN